LEFDLRSGLHIFTPICAVLSSIVAKFFREIIGIYQVTELQKMNAILTDNSRFSLTQINVRRPGRC